MHCRAAYKRWRVYLGAIPQELGRPDRKAHGGGCLMATLDILIPHFNDPEGLALSLRSISRQTWEGDYRIVTADDGSRPDIRRSVAAIAEHSAVKIDTVFNHVNRGRPYTRNALLDSIDSRYVASLDAGDEWYPTTLSTHFDFFNPIISATV